MSQTPIFPDPARRASSPSTDPPAFSPEQLREVALAQQRGKKIRRAVTTAKIDGGITAFFAGVCMLSSFLGIEGPILGVILGAVAFNSFRNAGKLAKFDRAAPAKLAMNQVYLAGAVILYALYELHANLTGSASGHLAELAGMGDMGADIAGLERTVIWAVYGGLIAGTILAQGLTGLYYFSRAKLVQEYMDQTPAWVAELQATAG